MLNDDLQLNIETEIMNKNIMYWDKFIEIFPCKSIASMFHFCLVLMLTNVELSHCL